MKMVGGNAGWLTGWLIVVWWWLLWSFVYTVTLYFCLKIKQNTDVANVEGIYLAFGFGLVALTLAYTVIVVVSLLVRPEEEQRQGIAKETAAASRHRAGSTNAQLFVNPTDFGFL